MSYAIRAGERLEEALRRIAREQVEEAIAEIDDPAVDAHETVHETRKRCKRIRALLRLYRPAFPDYAVENASFRDEARRLSTLRDATSSIECCDALAARYRDEPGVDALVEVRAGLEARRAELCESFDARKRLQAMRDALEAAAARIDDWALAGGTADSPDDFEPLGAGLERVYRRARKAMARARRQPDTEQLHEWRKRAKYLRHQLEILEPIWPAGLAPLHGTAKLVTDRLGDDHDLAVLARIVSEDRHRFDVPVRDVLLALLDRRRQELQAWARPPGARLLGEKPARFRKRMARTWRAWRLEQRLATMLPEGSDAVS